MTSKEEQQAIDEEEYRLALEEERWKEREEPEEAGVTKTTTKEHHKLLISKYGIPEDRVSKWTDNGVISSVDEQTALTLLKRKKPLDSGGILINYPKSNAILIRLDKPVPDEKGKSAKYLGPFGQPCALFNPGVDLEAEKEIYITEGPLKAICGFEQGIPIVALAGLWNWLNGSNQLSDEERLISELKKDWTDKKFVLLTDSDIVPGHRAYEDGAFQRLANALYYYGAEEVRVVALPDLTPDEIDPATSKSKKTGLDEFILARKDQAIPELRALVAGTEPVHHWTLDRKELSERLDNPSEDRKVLDFELLNPPYYDVLVNDFIQNKNTFSSDLWVKLKKSKLQDFSGLKNAVKKSGQEAKKIKINGKSIVVDSASSKVVEPGYEVPAKLLEGTVYQIIDRKTWKVDVREGTNERGEPTKDTRATPICHFVIWPTRKIHKSDGEYIELEGILPNGRRMKKIVVSMKEFRKMEWLEPMWQIEAAAVEPNKEKELKNCLGQMSHAGIPETMSYTDTGWTKVDDTWTYLHAGGAIGADWVEVELPDRLSGYSLPNFVDDPKTAIQTSIDLLSVAPHKIMYPLLGSVYLAPLVEPFVRAGYTPAEVIYLWGETGSHKSTLMALMLCHYGEFDYMTLPASFRGTTFSVEEMGHILKDSLFVVDDLKKTPDNVLKQKMFVVLGNLLRIYGNGQDRSRLQLDKESSGFTLQDAHLARGLLAVTGEYEPTEGSMSDLARTFSLPIKRGDIDEGKLTELQTQNNLLSQAMVSYLQWLVPKIDKLPKKFEDDFIEYRTKAREAAKTAGRHARLDHAVAHLYVGLKMFFRFAVTVEAITEEEMEEHLNAAWSVLNEVADEQTELGQTCDDSQVLSQVYSELMAQNNIYYLPMKGPIQHKSGFEVDVNPSRPKTLIGYGPDEDDVYYILMSSLVKAANDLLRGQFTNNNQITTEGVLDALERRQLLVTIDKKGKRRDRQFSKKIQGGTRYVAAIKGEFFNPVVEEE